MKELLLLHGALGAESDFNTLKSLISDEFEVFTLSFYGHARTAFSEQGFSIEAFAKQVLAFLDENEIDKIDIFGYSMGGYVALYLCLHFPDRINRVFTFATKYDWNPDSAKLEASRLNPDILIEKVPNYAKHLQNLHGEDNWQKLLSETANMMIKLSESNLLDSESLKSIKHDIRIGIGDKDKMVSLEETILLYRSLGNATLYVMPNCTHPIEKLDFVRLTAKIKVFFD